MARAAFCDAPTKLMSDLFSSNAESNTATKIVLSGKINAGLSLTGRNVLTLTENLYRFGYRLVECASSGQSICSASKVYALNLLEYLGPSYNRRTSLSATLLSGRREDGNFIP
jgi:hypothetical protein